MKREKYISPFLYLVCKEKEKWKELFGVQFFKNFEITLTI